MASTVKEKGFQWNARRLTAVTLIAEGRDIAEVAGLLNCSRDTIYRWSSTPEFQEKLNSIVCQLEKRFIKKSLENRTHRVDKLTQLFDKMMLVVERRARDMGEREIEGVLVAEEASGTSSGLLIRDYKDGSRVYKFDRGLVAEMRETLKQIAQELGQWTEKREETQINFDPSTLTDDQLKRIAAGEHPASVLANRGERA